MMIKSLRRPVTNSSPSLTKPRSPVRRNGPSPVVGEPRLKGLLRLGGAAPVTRGHAGASDPDFADFFGRARRADSGSTIKTSVPFDARPAADEPPRVTLVRRRFDDPVPRQRVGPHVAEDGRGGGSSARHFQRRFGETVGRVESLAAKAARPEQFGEPFQRLAADRLRAVVGHAPALGGRARHVARR